MKEGKFDLQNKITGLAKVFFLITKIVILFVKCIDYEVLPHATWGTLAKFPDVYFVISKG